MYVVLHVMSSVMSSVMSLVMSLVMSSVMSAQCEDHYSVIVITANTWPGARLQGW